jgi:protein-S-isoprenylcysteine O-methyltransferase Ste14
VYERYTDLASRIRVPASFALAALYLYFAEPTAWSLALGISIASAGLALRAASAGHLRKNSRLAVSGPYAYTRNPLYLGSALAGAGFAIAGGRWWFVAVLALFFAIVYAPVMRKEEAHLRRLFGEPYASYAAAVPLLLPRFSAWQQPGSTPEQFDASLYRSNREYEALVAFAVIVVVLCGKMYWRA